MAESNYVKDIEELQYSVSSMMLIEHQIQRLQYDIVINDK